MSDNEDSFDDFDDDDDEDQLDEDLGEEQEGGSTMRYVAYAVPALLVVLVIGLIGHSFGGNKSTAELVPTARVAAPSDLNPLEESALSVPVPFGRKARNECALTCYSSEVDRELCLRGCNRLVVGEFARRIAADEPEPQKVARQIAADCRVHADKSERMQSADVWRSAVTEARKTLSEFRADVDLYESTSLLPRFTVLELIEKSLGRPESLGKNAETFAAALQTQVCVREIIVATQLAIVYTAQSRDLYSESFYRGLERELLGENARLESSMKSLGEKVL